MPIEPGSDAYRLVTSIATTMAVMCGKARTREIAALVIEEVKKDGCQDGIHPLGHYINAWRDVVARRGDQNEMIALVAAMKLYLGEPTHG